MYRIVPFALALIIGTFASGNPYGWFSGTVRDSRLTDEAAQHFAQSANLTPSRAEQLEVEYDLVTRHGDLIVQVTVTGSRSRTLPAKLRNYHDYAEVIVSKNPSDEQLHDAVVECTDRLASDLRKNLRDEQPVVSSGVSQTQTIVITATMTGK